MILNNSAVINLVNDKIKLELRSFIRVINLKATIKYGILKLLIISHRTYILKRVF
jgi:hypothetical protein